MDERTIEHRIWLDVEADIEYAMREHCKGTHDRMALYNKIIRELEQKRRLE